MDDFAIRTVGLSKQYRIGQLRGGYDTLREDIVRLARSVVGGRDRRARGGQERFWALDDVSLEVATGEVVGVIGRNGAGKTTLLKILSRITEPTRGYADVVGRLGSLLEVGTGFHPELTGRENVFLNGAILGMRRTEIARKFDEIVDFAGIEKFVDTPVKRYSSGMYVRLAFSVAAHLEPEILLVDEVLAVGDAEFQRKCLGKMQDVTNEGRTILFVSHNMPAIRGLCSRVVLLDRGRIVFDGAAEEGVARYLDAATASNATATDDELAARVSGLVRRHDPFMRCRAVSLVDEAGNTRTEFTSDEPIEVVVTYECFKPIPAFELIVVLTDSDGVPLLRTENVDDPKDAEHYSLQPGVYRTSCVFPAGLFGERRFFVDVHLSYHNVEHLDYKRILSFDVNFVGHNNNYSPNSKQAFLRPQLGWETRSLDVLGDDRVGRTTFGNG